MYMYKKLGKYKKNTNTRQHVPVLQYAYMYGRKQRYTRTSFGVYQEWRRKNLNAKSLHGCKSKLLKAKLRKFVNPVKLLPLPTFGIVIVISRLHNAQKVKSP